MGGLTPIQSDPRAYFAGSNKFEQIRAHRNLAFNEALAKPTALAAAWVD
jgi:hypothetical protein